VSFIVPVHDGAPYLAECLGSIVAQTVTPLEVLVVDDGSTDRSAAIAGSFGEPVRCLRQARAGPAAARNLGVSRARGDLLAFLDADDLIPPHKLERQLRCFAADPTLQFCDAYARNFWTPEIPPEARNVAPREAFTHGEAPKPRMIITWLLRRSLFDRLGQFDEALGLGEDDDWRDRVDAARVPAETVDEVLAMRRLHPKNLTRQRYDEYLRHVARRSKARMDRARADRAR
jgi:glycosyltransferase involved in cell wall biosynthesis